MEKERWTRDEFEAQEKILGMEKALDMLARQAARSAAPLLPTSPPDGEAASLPLDKVREMIQSWKDTENEKKKSLQKVLWRPLMDDSVSGGPSQWVTDNVESRRASGTMRMVADAVYTELEREEPKIAPRVRCDLALDEQDRTEDRYRTFRLTWRNPVTRKNFEAAQRVPFAELERAASWRGGPNLLTEIGRMLTKVLLAGVGRTELRAAYGISPGIPLSDMVPEFPRGSAALPGKSKRRLRVGEE